MAAFTPNQNTALFTNVPQMALPDNIRARLALEGLVNVDDFDYFKEYQLDQAFKNMCTDILVIPDVVASGGAVAVPPVTPVPTVTVSAKCAFCLKVSSIVYH